MTNRKLSLLMNQLPEIPVPYRVRFEDGDYVYYTTPVRGIDVPYADRVATLSRMDRPRAVVDPIRGTLTITSASGETVIFSDLEIVINTTQYQQDAPSPVRHE